MEANAGTDPQYSLLSFGVRYFFSDYEYFGGPRKKLITPCPELTARNAHPTGSNVEDLNLPDLIELRTWKQLKTTDDDFMICQNIDDRLVFKVENHSQHETLRPGHVYLRVPWTLDLPLELISYLYLWKHQLYIRNDIFSDTILLLDRVVSKLHSPGGYKHFVFEKETFLGLTSSDGSIHCDSVPCVAIQWPEDAQAWRARKREYGWPTMQMIERVLVNGCHLVSKPHPFSACQAIEWRYSFSMAELRLAETLDHLQRVSYKVFKALIKYHEKTYGLGISSYYLKTTFFWVCEQSPRSTWTLNNLGRSFLCLLDTLLEFLQDHNLPHYFIPEHNLIEHLPQEAVNRWIIGLEFIRRHPLECMHDFHSIYTSNLFIGPIKNIQFIGNVMKFGYRILRELVSISCQSSLLTNAMHALMIFAIYYGVEGQHSTMLSLAEVLYHVPDFSAGIRLTMPDERSIGNLTDELFMLKKNYLLCIDLLLSNKSIKSTMDILSVRQCERLLSALRAEVACICYQMSRNPGTDREELGKEAECFFLSAIEHANCVWTSQVKYAQYLMHRKRYEEAYPLLQKVIREPVKYEDWDRSTYIMYSKYTDESVETTLKALHAIEEQEMWYHAHALSYYLLYICRKELGRDPGDYCIPNVDEYGQELGVSKTYILEAHEFFKACLLLRYGHLHKALCVFMAIQYDLKAIYFIWYIAAKLFCTYFKECQRRLK